MGDGVSVAIVLIVTLIVGELVSPGTLGDIGDQMAVLSSTLCHSQFIEGNGRLNIGFQLIEGH